MTRLEQMEQLTLEYAKARSTLVERVEHLETAMARLKRRRLNGIRRAACRERGARERLAAAILEHSDLFTRPKTVTIHGVRIGLRKGREQVVFRDSGQVLRLIRRHLAEQAETLIRTTESPVKSALARLPEKDLRKIGVGLVCASEEVVIRSVDPDVEKLVALWLQEEAA